MFVQRQLDRVFRRHDLCNLRLFQCGKTRLLLFVFGGFV